MLSYRKWELETDKTWDWITFSSSPSFQSLGSKLEFTSNVAPAQAGFKFEPNGETTEEQTLKLTITILTLTEDDGEAREGDTKCWHEKKILWELFIIIMRLSNIKSTVRRAASFHYFRQLSPWTAWPGLSTFPSPWRSQSPGSVELVKVEAASRDIATGFIFNQILPHWLRREWTAKSWFRGCSYLVHGI